MYTDSLKYKHRKKHKGVGLFTRYFNIHAFNISFLLLLSNTVYFESVNQTKLSYGELIK